MTELETLLLGALKQCDEAMSYMSEYDIPIMLPMTVKQAIAAAEAEQPDEVQRAVDAEREAIIRKSLELGALEDGAYIEAIRARSNKH